MDTITIPGSPFPIDGVMVFGWIAIFLLMGMALRYYVPFFRKYLIPSCILGGVAGFILQSCGVLRLTGFEVSNELFQIVVFHIFNLTWVFLGLKMPFKHETKADSKASFKTIIWLFVVMQAVNFLVSGVASTTSAVLSLVGLNAGPASLGALTSAAFLGGPGQALTASSVWTQNSTFLGLNDYALASSSAGYAFAIMLGIPLMNIIARKKKITLLSNPSEAEQNGFYDAECGPSIGKETTIATSIDVFAFHFALGLAAYALILFIFYLIAPFLPAGLLPILWGLFFVSCYLSGMFVRKLIVMIDKTYLCSNEINNRITGSLVDFLVCGTFISIQVGSVNAYLTPFLFVSLICAITVAVVSWYACGKLKSEGPEHFAFLFGTLTGTISTGMILTRMVDPENKSSAAVNWGAANAIGMPFIMLLTIVSHLEVVYHYSVWLLIGINFVLGTAFLIYSFFVKVDRTAKLWE